MSPTTSNDNRDHTFTVTQLNRRVKDLLEVHFPLVWVEGEISNLSRPASGHWYFTLKDERAQISCAMFKRRNSDVKFTPAVGDHLKIRARVSLYEGRGDYQLIVEHMEQAGFGLLQKRFEELKMKLLEKGLFDEGFKKPLPNFVRRLAVVTSPSGAVLHDVLSVLERRFPAMHITIVPAPVQGEDAPQKLIKAIEIADQASKFDAILLCRGGGSIEDLWAFNSELLAHTIFSCKTPIVSAVGHEVDVTIADFVADARAPTPSAAAEMLSPNMNELQAALLRSEGQMQRLVINHIERLTSTVTLLAKHIKHPRAKIEQWQQRLDNSELRLARSIDRAISRNTQGLAAFKNALHLHSPYYSVHSKREHLQRLHQNMIHSLASALGTRRNQYQSLVAQLDIMSPIATVSRGYSIAKNASGEILRSISQVNSGDTISLRVSDGEINAAVSQVKSIKATN